MTRVPSPDDTPAEPFSRGTFALFRRPNGNIQLVARISGQDEEFFFPPKEFGGVPAESLEQAQEFFGEIKRGGPLAAFRMFRKAQKALGA